MYRLGIDIGSTTTKLVLINEKGELLFTDYSYNNGNSLQAFHSALQRMRDALGQDIEIAGSCSTGYGEQLLKTAFRLDHGIHKVVSLQPFGCIANHIISKGIERRYKDLYPHLSLLFLDFDAGTSDAKYHQPFAFFAAIICRNENILVILHQF